MAVGLDLPAPAQADDFGRAGRDHWFGGGEHEAPEDERLDVRTSLNGTLYRPELGAGTTRLIRRLFWATFAPPVMCQKSCCLISPAGLERDRPPTRRCGAGLEIPSSASAFSTTKLSRRLPYYALLGLASCRLEPSPTARSLAAREVVLLPRTSSSSRPRPRCRLLRCAEHTAAVYLPTRRNTAEQPRIDCELATFRRRRVLVAGPVAHQARILIMPRRGTFGQGEEAWLERPSEKDLCWTC